MRSVSLVDVMHPEKADACASVHNSSRRTTVWGTVMNEICGELPIAVAVPDEERVQEAATRTPDDHVPSNTSGETPNTSHTIREGDVTATMPDGVGCCYLEGLVGCTFSFAAVLTTFAIELPAATCYCFAAGFYSIVSSEKCPILFKALLMVLVRAFMVVDFILLTVSVFITEILGAITGCITSLFSIRRVAVRKDWHLYVRKVCHLTRWAFRDFHEGWALTRSFPTFDSDVDEPVNPQETVVEDSSPTNGSKGPVQTPVVVVTTDV